MNDSLDVNEATAGKSAGPDASWPRLASIHQPFQNFVDGLRNFAARESLREAASILFIVVLGSTMLWPAWHGDWPVGHDHTLHLFRIWQLKETLLAHGTPWSWSHRWFAGYPQNSIYPVGTDFFVLAVHLLSLGKLTIAQAYGVAFWLFYVAYGYAAYFFVHHALRSRIAALISVVFLLTDPGSNDIGGWFWIVDVGVWTAAVGMIPALIGTVCIAELLQNPTPKRAGVIALCVGAALLCHPLEIIYFALTIPILFACHYATAGPTPWRRVIFLLTAALVLGVLIASFWLVPRLAATPYIAEIGHSGSTIAEIGLGIATGRLFDRMPWLATAFGLIGTLFLLRARRTLPLFIPIFTFLSIAISSSSFAALFGPDIADWLNKHIIFPRLLMVVKPFWYGAAGFLLVASGRTIASQFGSGPRLTASARALRIRQLFRGAALLLFLCAVVGPIFFYAIKVFIKDEVLRPTPWNSQRKDLAARAEFVSWAKATLPRESGFFRIAHGFDQDEHNLTDLGIDVPCPFYKIYVSPTGDHFKYALGGSATADLRAANVRYILAEHPINRPDFLFDRTFGGLLRWYRFRDWNPNPFEIFDGGGEVKLVTFRDEEIVLNAGADAHGLLRLNVSYFPKWQATRDGSPVAITPIAVAQVDKSAFMQVPLFPGTYRFVYRRSTSDYAGNFLCLLGIAGCTCLFNWNRLSRRALKKVH